VKHAVILALLFLLPGCAVIGHQKVAGWPQLAVIEHYVPNKAMRDRCAQYVGFGMSPEACAQFDFARGRCDIWYSADFPPGSYVITHEREHCLGYEHEGETGMAEALARYKSSLRRAGL
jgi:hypothetical protein